MSNLRTDYKDDVFTGSRKYHTVNNPDGTVSFTDETEYEQNGDTYGAAQINEVNDIINNLDASAYRKTDSVENALADNDYFPFYDTSATASKKTTWSSIKNLLTQLLAIKVHNSNSAGTYGAGNASLFGHVKLSDNYASSAGNASQSVGASSQAVYGAYTNIVSELTANNNRIYMDYKNGKYGYNTSANRGADTFVPFNRIQPEQFHLYNDCASGTGARLEILPIAPNEYNTMIISVFVKKDFISNPMADKTYIELINANGEATRIWTYNKDASGYVEVEEWREWLGLTFNVSGYVSVRFTSQLIGGINQWHGVDNPAAISFDVTLSQ